jgi:hypothetical protein
MIREKETRKKSSIFKPSHDALVLTINHSKQIHDIILEYCSSTTVSLTCYFIRFALVNFSICSLDAAPHMQVGRHSKKPFGFTLAIPQRRTYFFSAPSEEELEKWIEEVSVNIELKRNPPSPSLLILPDRLRKSPRVQRTRSMSVMKLDVESVSNSVGTFV